MDTATATATTGTRVHHRIQRRHGLSTGNTRLIAVGTVTGHGHTANEGTPYIVVDWDGPEGGVQTHRPADIVPADAPLEV